MVPISSFFISRIKYLGIKKQSIAVVSWTLECINVLNTLKESFFVKTYHEFEMSDDIFYPGYHCIHYIVFLVVIEFVAKMEVPVEHIIFDF